MMMTKKLIFILALFACQLSYASDKTLIRLGVLSYGTANWELEIMRGMGRIETETYQLEIMPMANPQAGKIALQSGAVDMIVADWIWVSYQRGLGRDYVFYPYSNTTGALVVAKNSTIKTWQDLKSKKLAIAGGELDKNSLLLRALMQKKGQGDLFSSIEKVYGAPPLLTQQLTHQRVDALLTYWHYAARLEAQGYKVLMTGSDILQGLDIKQKVASIGYVFNETWANNHRAALQEFLQSTQQAKDALCSEDTSWNNIKSLIRAKTEQVSNVLRQRFCAGRVTSWGVKEQQAAGKIYLYLKELSHKRLTGKAEQLDAGSFWK